MSTAATGGMQAVKPTVVLSYSDKNWTAFQEALLDQLAHYPPMYNMVKYFVLSPPIPPPKRLDNSTEIKQAQVDYSKADTALNPQHRNCQLRISWQTPDLLAYDFDAEDPKTRLMYFCG